MLYSYKDCKQIYHTDYALRNAVLSGELIKISRGIYSDNGKEKQSPQPQNVMPAPTNREAFSFSHL